MANLTSGSGGHLGRCSEQAFARGVELATARKTLEGARRAYEDHFRWVPAEPTRCLILGVVYAHLGITQAP